MAAEHDTVDEVTGKTTTGHVWDGIRELNNPLPRWWLMVFYATIVWGLAYVVAYPAIPLATTFSKGLLGYSSRESVEAELEGLKALRGESMVRLASAEPEAILADPKLLGVAQALGKAAFGTNCAPCHGQGAQGARSYPDLNDDQWLWGGTLADIKLTIAHGIRNENPQSRVGPMPAFGRDGLIPKADIPHIAAHVRSLSGKKTDGAYDLAKGGKLFAENCAACHGDAGKGNPEVGAPNLTADIWLYGGDMTALVETIVNGRAGVMPGWADRLDPAAVNALTVYVHTLGGGRK